MKEIKFRAWDKKSKKMREVNSIAFDEKGLSVVNMWGFSVIEDKRVIVHKDAKYVELMQALGIKDKTGKDIYAKDILRGKFGTGLGGKSTKYKEFNFSVDIHTLDSGLCSFINMPNGYGDYRFMPYLSLCTVIGNLYETTQLLNNE